MRKFFAAFLTIMALLLLNSKAFAEDFDYGGGELIEALPDEAREFLESEEITPEAPRVFSFGEALTGAWELLKNQAGKPLRMLCGLCGVVLFCALAESVAEAGNLKTALSVVGVLCGAGIAAAAMYEVLEGSLAAISAAANFMLVFIPVLTGISAALGHTLTAAAVNSAILGGTQLFSQLAANFLAPFCGAILGVSTAGAVQPQFKLDKLAEVIKKIVVWALSLVMTIFMGVLSLQTAVSAASDNAAIKTAKFVVSQGVPLVGGTVSDAVNTLQSGISILKSSVGVYGMIAVGVMIVPVLASLICYKLAALAAEGLAEMFGQKELTALFKSFGAVITIITAIVICVLLIN
ncbi:MAG: stage III sporulation protein AE, partial [Oscillospiraceae bacterium]|nr:stage III sporulation protein AE [Oscillospiraceae bacterium]